MAATRIPCYQYVITDTTEQLVFDSTDAATRGQTIRGVLVTNDAGSGDSVAVRIEPEDNHGQTPDAALTYGWRVLAVGGSTSFTAASSQTVITKIYARCASGAGGKLNIWATS